MICETLACLVIYGFPALAVAVCGEKFTNGRSNFWDDDEEEPEAQPKPKKKKISSRKQKMNRLLGKKKRKPQ